MYAYMAEREGGERERQRDRQRERERERERMRMSSLPKRALTQLDQGTNPIRFN